MVSDIAMRHERYFYGFSTVALRVFYAFLRVVPVQYPYNIRKIPVKYPKDIRRGDEEQTFSVRCARVKKMKNVENEE